MGVIVNSPHLTHKDLSHDNPTTVHRDITLFVGKLIATTIGD